MIILAALTVLLFCTSALGDNDTKSDVHRVTETPEQPQFQFVPSKTTAVLRVTSSPADADIYISRFRRHKGEYAGKAPLEKELSLGRYFVWSTMDGYATAKADIRLDPNEIETLNFAMQRIYPRNPYDIVAHSLFWPGLGLSAFAFPYTMFAIINDVNKMEAAIVCISAGALIGTAITLWIIAPSDKEYYERTHGPVAMPTPDGHGGMAGYVGTF